MYVFHSTQMVCIWILHSLQTLFYQEFYPKIVNYTINILLTRISKVLNDITIARWSFNKKGLYKVNNISNLGSEN